MKTKKVNVILKERTSRKAYEITETYIEFEGRFLLAERELKEERESCKPNFDRHTNLTELSELLNLSSRVF